MKFLQHNSEKGWKIEVKKPNSNWISKRPISIDSTLFSGHNSEIICTTKMGYQFFCSLMTIGLLFWG